LSPISLPTPIIPPRLSELYHQVITVGNIHDAMIISNFLNPIEEEEDEEDNGHTIGEDEVL
jgi:predicted PolB exonuclease-like 3'-5' exonuclease